jgi:hypothetical protein
MYLSESVQQATSNKQQPIGTIHSSQPFHGQPKVKSQNDGGWWMVDDE